MEVVSLPLAKLNEQAERNAFKLEDVDWSRPIEYTLKWMPEGMVHIRFLPSYPKMSALHRLRYNQLYGLAICEQFIWFEEGIVIPIMQRILRGRNLPAELRACLEHFIADEVKHSELFKRLLRKVDSSWNGYRFLDLSAPQAFFYRTVVRHPGLFSAWIWMTIYFEERTMHFSRLYNAEKYKGGKAAIDPTFARAHHLHMIDEARHLQVDQYLLRYLYDPEPRWKKVLASRMMERVMEAYASPSRIARAVVALMKHEFPADTPLFDDIIAELPSLRHNADFLVALFGDEALPRTRALLKVYPEMLASLAVISPPA
jgi:hypothetical protein